MKPTVRSNQIVIRKAIAMLGGRCYRCGIDDWRVLQFDHIHGQRGQRKHERGHHMARMLLAGKVPAQIIQLLCANCHQIKSLEEDAHGIVRYPETDQEVEAIGA